MVHRKRRSFSGIPFLSGPSFDSKVKAVNDSSEINSNLIEEYQVKAVDCYQNILCSF